MEESVSTLCTTSHNHTMTDSHSGNVHNHTTHDGGGGGVITIIVLLLLFLCIRIMGRRLYIN